MSHFITNAWYAIASSAEVGRHLLAREVLGQSLVLYRTESGSAVALRDRCAHRFAPLSMGGLVGDSVQCLYHGMQYDCSGNCVRIPGQERIPPTARVQHFPAQERYGLVFAWMGDPACADAHPLIDIPQYQATGWGLSRGYSLFAARWQNIVDNLVDPAHTSFVHTRTIGNSAADDIAVVATEEDGVVVCRRWVDGAAPVPMMARFLGHTRPLDRWQIYRLKPPGISWVDFGAVEAGTGHTEADMDNAPYRTISYAFITPRDARSTHYFSFQLRNFAADDAAVTAEFEALYKATFDEDRALLEAIEREEAKDAEAQPVRIVGDAGVVRLRRLLASLSTTRA